jgi:hypothetical protein
VLPSHLTNGIPRPTTSPNPQLDPSPVEIWLGEFAGLLMFDIFDLHDFTEKHYVL